MINKKGMTAGMLVAIIITLAAFMLIASVIIQFMTNVDDKQAELICHDSLILKANSKIEAGSAGAVSIPMACKTLDNKFSAVDSKEAQDIIVSKFERCWWIWLEGQYSEMFGPRGLFGDDDKTKCFVCYNLIYEKGPPLTKGELLNSLKDTKSRYLTNSSVLDYIQKNGYINIEDELKDGHVYSLVFASNIKEGFWRNSFGRQLGFYPVYNKNGLWFVDLNTLNKANPCYVEKDIAGK
ncbi:hypothetical protein HYX11_02310 [Candidatus Woesearchaeota archaeon]|nr:hypothetical protein [Candidatus Woesearchaeota archaeon]